MPLCALEVIWLGAENGLWADDLRVWEAGRKKKKRVEQVDAVE